MNIYLKKPRKALTAKFEQPKRKVIYLEPLYYQNGKWFYVKNNKEEKAAK